MVDVQVIALPFAGGNSYSFSFLKAFLPSWIHWETLEYPGHGKMSSLPLTDSTAALVDVVLKQYRHCRSKSQAQKTVLYGHSMGSAIALEILAELTQLGEPLPSCVVVSGRGAPHTAAKRDLSSLSDPELLKFFHRNGSFSAEILKETALMEYILPILRNDLRLLETSNASAVYDYQIPMLVLNGKQDILLPEEISGWSDYSRLPVEYIEMDGAHFFIQQYPQDFMNHLINFIHDAI